MARIQESDSTFIERLVLRLLLAMGFGGSEEEAAEHLGRSGDQGVDGVIDEDKLGLDRIYVQAKRWAENPVRRPEIQAFVGVLEGQGASKGLFITTSRSTQEAESYAEGIRLAALSHRPRAGVLFPDEATVSCRDAVEALRGWSRRRGPRKQDDTSTRMEPCPRIGRDGLDRRLYANSGRDRFSFRPHFGR